MKTRLFVIIPLLLAVNIPTQLYSKSIIEFSIAGLETSDKADSAAEETLSDKVKGCFKNEGLFTIYQDSVTGGVKIYILKDQIGREFIYQSFSLGGPPSLFLNQNMIRTTWVFKIGKSFDKLQWTRSNTKFYFDPENEISKSANADVSEAIFYSEKIIIEDSIGYLINGDNLFLSEKARSNKTSYCPKDSC